MKVILDITNPELKKQLLEQVDPRNVGFTLEEIMEYYDRSDRTIFRWINDGKIVKIDGLYYINKKKTRE